MYFDDSHTEAKVTDVTHCDLETKSILKPPKTRAPLQEVDLGNHITVEFDVIRKRRVSFAGVNKIKEFNSEAKSFSICNTPAYEEKVSTSSDSSALSSSVSGNINSLTKENDITILDDTMDLTDLSIVQPSAMDITAIKPQKPLQDVPDIFAPRSQDSSLFSSQEGINRPVFTNETNKPNVEDRLERNPFQNEPVKSNEPEDTPLALDPRKMLLNELLEESAVDCSVDNYLKANILFAQNNCNVGEGNKCEIKKLPLEVSEMDFTQALSEPIKSETYHFQPLEKKDSDREQIYTKTTTSKPSNLFGTLGMDLHQSYRLQDTVLENENQKALQKSKQSHMFPNFNCDESKSMKIDASQMEFTEALPSKNFNLAQNNLVASNYITDRLLARSNTSPMERPNPAQNMFQGHLNYNSNCNESRSGNSNMSQMEFTEALPSKNMVRQNLVGNIHTTGSLLQAEQTKPFQKLMPNHMTPNFNIDESRSGNNNVSQMEFTEALPSKNIHQNLGYHTGSSVPQLEQPKQFPKPMPSHIIEDESRARNSDVSQMEFTEVLPSKNIGCQNLVNQANSSVSQTEHPKVFPKLMPSRTIQNFHVDESRSGNNVSQMEFTEALPSKYIGHQNLVDPTSSSVLKVVPKSIPNHTVPNFNIDESRLGNSNVSQMEFTEALPSKNIGRQNLIDHTNSSVSQFPKSIPSHTIPNYYIDESRVKNCNTSQMEFTEAIPSKNVLPHNFNIDLCGHAKSNNTTQMELTEAPPMRNVQPALNNAVASNYFGDRLIDKNNSSHLMPLKPSRNEIQNNKIPNLNTDMSKTISCNDATEKKFTEALSAELSHNNIILSNYVGELEEKLNITHFMPEKPSLYDIQSDMFSNLKNNEESKSMKKNNASENESPEALPVDIDPNIVLNNTLPVPNISEVINSNPSSNLNTDQSVSSERNNASQIEFTEVLSSKELPHNNIVTSNVTENRLSVHSDISQMENTKINLNYEKHNFVACTEKVNETSQMEFTEAVPMLNISKRQTTPYFACNSSGFHGNASQKNVILDRENIPPPQDLNESNSMDVTELNFADSENGMYNVDCESVQECMSIININRKLFCDGLKQTGDFSNMEFTEGLPTNILRSDGRTELKSLDNNEMKNNCPFQASGVGNILGNSSCMEFTNALPTHKEACKSVISPIQNVSLENRDEIPNELNVSNYMDMTQINQPDIVRNIKGNGSAQLAFNLEQSISKDVSQMEFTEALPARNIQAAFNYARPMNLSGKPSSKTSPNYNLQTSNMEFTEVLPMMKQATINSKGMPEDISSSHDILQNKIISSEHKLNDSCSMDVTNIENVPNHDIFKNSKECIEVSDKDEISIISNDCSDFPKSEIKEKLSDELNKNPQNFPFLSGSQNNFVTERKTSGELQSDFSQLEFTEALPVRNEPNAFKTEKDIFGNENNFVHEKKSIIMTHENDSLDTTNMEFTEFLHKPNAQHFIFASENKEKENKVIVSTNKENVDNFSSDDVTRTENILKNAVVEKRDEINTQGSPNKHISDELAIQKNIQIDKLRTEFLQDLEQDYKNLPSKPYENIFPGTNQFVNSSVDTAQMDFTDAAQPQMKDNIKLDVNYIVNEKKSSVLVDSELDVNKIADASQMEFTEAITVPKCQSDSYQNVSETKFNNNNFTNVNPVENSEAAMSESKELFRPIDENKSDVLPLASSVIQKNISLNEDESEMKNPISEDVKIAKIDQIQQCENGSLKGYSQSKYSKEELVVNSCPQIFQNSDKINKNSMTISSHTTSSDICNNQKLTELNKVKTEPVSSTQSLKPFSPMHVDEPSTPTVDRKDNKVNSLRKLFENESKSDNSRADFNTPKGKQFSATRSTEGNSYESSTSTVVKTLTVDNASQKKNLVHFNTPPVRIIKRRKTMGFPDAEESVQLLQSTTSDLASPLEDVSIASDLQNASQRRGIFDEKKKSDYDPEKGKEEWNRLVKNDAFMKERSFHFVNPCKWKYEFRWPVDLVLEIPDIEVSENSRKKNISLVSNISESDHISVFINNQMKKNMSCILSEKWLNSHCKTIKDLLFTIKFIEEEYNKLEPLISSMKYFYQEFPFDFSSNRIVFQIVNLRKEFCFEVKIDVSYGQVKGKNIDVINHVGEVSKTNVQKLFDHLQPSTERFYLFWQKLMEIDEL